MEPQVIEIALKDGSSNCISVFDPDQSPNAPIVLCFPAMGVMASYYRPLAEELCLQGIVAITADLRGLGHSSIRPSRQVDFGYEDMLTLDYQGVFELIAEQYPSNPVYVLGHSLGGQLGALYLSRFPRSAKGLILVGVASQHFGRVHHERQGEVAVGESAAFVGSMAILNLAWMKRLVSQTTTR